MGGAEEGVVACESAKGARLVTYAQKRVASTAQGTKFIQWCALTWGRDGGGDTGVADSSRVAMPKGGGVDQRRLT